MSNYVLSSDADFDLDEIWEYIAADDIDAADSWIGKLFDAFDALARMPGMGHTRNDLTDYIIQCCSGPVSDEASAPSRQNLENSLVLP